MKKLIYALIKFHQKVLLLKRPSNKKKYASYWNFPGGNIESGETDKACVKREVREETGIEFTPTEEIYNKIWKDENIQVIVYSGEVNTHKVKLCDEHVDFIYLTKENIKTLTTMPYIKQLLKIGDKK